LKHKTLIATALAGLLIGIAGAVILKEYLHPMTAEVVSITLTRTLEGTPLAQDEPIDWGIVENGSTYTFTSLNVTNNGTVSCTVYLWHNAPAGWAITWTANNSVLAPGESAVAALELYVASDAVQGQVYSWDCYVRAE